MAQIDVEDFDGVRQTVAKVTSTGSTADVNSLPVTKSTEDKASDTALIASVDELTNPATNVGSTAYEASRVLSVTPGRLFTLTGHNSKVSAQFIQLHNTTSVPADTAVPVLTFSVPAGGSFSLDYGARGRSFSTGITVCNSSTGPTKTVGSADCFFDAQVGAA